MSDDAELQAQGGTPGGAAAVSATSSEPEFDVMTTPLFFAEEILGLRLYDWQTDVLNWYRNPKRRTMGALCTPNGAGKSSGVVAALATWWIWIYPKGKVVITTKDSKQLEEQLYPAMERHRGKFPEWRWVTSPYIQIETKQGGKIVAFTTNDPGRAEGWHKLDDLTGPLLVIVDEAKSVEPAIFEAIDRCTFNALLYVSSPGLKEGQFYDAMTKLGAAKKQEGKLFISRSVTLLECPHIPQDKIDGMILKYGQNHPLVRSSVYGEFMDEGDIPYVFKRAEVQRAWKTAADGGSNPPRIKRGLATYFCDFAGGGDENVFAKREGNVLSVLDAWHEKDTRGAAYRFLLNFRKSGCSASQIFGDNGGLGKAFIDALAELGWEIGRVDNQSPPWDRNYMNRGAEMWHETSSAFRRGEVVLDIPLEEQDLTLGQLVSRRAIVQKLSGRIGVEAKEDMKARGIKSPDRADALCGAWACGELGGGAIVEKNPFEEYEDMHEAALAMAGVPDGWETGF